VYVPMLSRDSPLNLWVKRKNVKRGSVLEISEDKVETPPRRLVATSSIVSRSASTDFFLRGGEIRQFRKIYEARRERLLLPVAQSCVVWWQAHLRPAELRTTAESGRSEHTPLYDQCEFLQKPVEITINNLIVLF